MDSLNFASTIVDSLIVDTNQREELIEITDSVARLVGATEKNAGVCVVFSTHTTCGITVNENADPTVKSDMLGMLARLIPEDEPAFEHAEQNSDAHIKTTLVGTSVTIPFEDGKLRLGRWQGIFLCEFDGPRKRTVLVSVI